MLPAKSLGFSFCLRLVHLCPRQRRRPWASSWGPGAETSRSIPSYEGPGLAARASLPRRPPSRPAPPIFDPQVLLLKASRKKPVCSGSRPGSKGQHVAEWGRHVQLSWDSPAPYFLCQGRGCWDIPLLHRCPGGMTCHGHLPLKLFPCTSGPRPLASGPAGLLSCSRAYPGPAPLRNSVPICVPLLGSLAL